MTLVLLAMLVLVVGKKITRVWWGVFIDQRDTWSLTRFQLVVWTFAILPVILAVAVSRATADAALRLHRPRRALGADGDIARQPEGGGER